MRRYVLLPNHGLRWPGGRARVAAELARIGAAPIVLDTLVGAEQAGVDAGAALVSMPGSAAQAVRRRAPELQLAPLRLYRTALARPEILVRPAR